MQNVKLSIVKKILTIKVDLTERLGPSASGKTIGVASTRGNVEVPGSDGVVLGLNAYVYPNPKRQK